MSHQRAASTSSISSNSDTQHRSNSLRFADPPSSNNTTSAATPSSPLSISIPRQRSFSSSLSFAATSPSARTFTGSSIIANSGNGYFNPGATGGPTTPLSAVFAPLSPASATPPTGSMVVGSLPSPSVSTGASQAMPVLHRRFSSSFHQLNMAGTSPNSGGVGSQANPDRGRRASYFGGSSPPVITATTAAAAATGAAAMDANKMSSSPSSTGAGGLFRKFSTTGRSAGHPLDRNDTGPANLSGAQPNGQNKQTLQQLHAALAHASDNHSQQQQQQQHLSAVDKLKKPSQDKHSRSSSPMRSMILNGQMLD